MAYSRAKYEWPGLGSVLNTQWQPTLQLQGIQRLSPASMDSHTDKYIPPLPTPHIFKKLLFLF